MRKLISIFLAFEFFIWLLPLGAFIDPAKEKLACDGQRAICLCSHLLAKHHSPMGIDKILFQSASEVQKEKNNSAGQNFLFTSLSNLINPSERFSFQTKQLLYTLLAAKPVEHVPKI